MDLILWRHCDAASSAPDMLRPLTARGHAEARQVAQWLSLRLPSDCRILVSPALRAQQTAQALKRAFETSSALAPGSAVSDVLQAASWPVASVATLIVGHEPTLGAVAGYLLDGVGSQRALSKGAVAWMSSIDGEPTRAILKTAVTPQLL